MSEWNETKQWPNKSFKCERKCSYSCMIIQNEARKMQTMWNYYMFAPLISIICAPRQLVAIELNWTELNRSKPKSKDFCSNWTQSADSFCTWIQSLFKFQQCIAHLLHCGGLQCSICVLKVTWALHANRWKNTKEEKERDIQRKVRNGCFVFCQSALENLR